MAEYTGIVMARQGQRARVKIDRSNEKGIKRPKFLDCWNAFEAKLGTHVEIDRQEISRKDAKLTIYGLPILTAIAGAAMGRGLAGFFGWPVLWTMAGGLLLWFIIGWNYAATFKRDVYARGEQWTITGTYYGNENVIQEDK